VNLGVEFGGGCFVDAQFALVLAYEGEFEVVDEDGEADFGLDSASVD